jgi:hypothetical protein
MNGKLKPVLHGRLIIIGDFTTFLLFSRISTRFAAAPLPNSDIALTITVTITDVCTVVIADVETAFF